MEPEGYLAGLPKDEPAELRQAVRRFESLAYSAVQHAREIDERYFRPSLPPLAFAWPVDDQDALCEPLIRVRWSALLMCVPSGWLRIVRPVSTLRLAELEAGENMARAFCRALREFR